MWNLPPPPGFQGLDPNKPLTVYERHLPHWRQDGATYFVTFRLADSLPQTKLDELAALKLEWEQRQKTAQESRPTTGEHDWSSKTARENRPTTGEHDWSSKTARESRPTTGEHDWSSKTARESRPTIDENPSCRTALLSRLAPLSRQIEERVERWLDQGMGSCVLKQTHLAKLVTSSMHHFDGERYELCCYVVMPNHVHAILRPLLPEVYPLEDIVGSWKKHNSRRINRDLGRAGELWQEETFDRIIRDEEHLWRSLQYVGSNPDKAGLLREACLMWIRPQWIAIGWKFDPPTKSSWAGSPEPSEYGDGSGEPSYDSLD
jgi:putative transposase